MLKLRKRIMKINKISNMVLESGYPTCGIYGHLSEKPTLSNPIEKYYRPMPNGLLKGSKINYLA